MNEFADAVFGCMKLLLAAVALCFVAAIPVSLDLASSALAMLR